MLSCVETFVSKTDPFLFVSYKFWGHNSLVLLEIVLGQRTVVVAAILSKDKGGVMRLGLLHLGGRMAFIGEKPLKGCEVIVGVLVGVFKLVDIPHPWEVLLVDVMFLFEPAEPLEDPFIGLIYFHPLILLSKRP